MSSRPLPLYAFPLTPEDEADMADMEPETNLLVTQLAPTNPSELNIVDTPTSPSSAFALSRFEFELGRGIDGTKVLMVEWDSTAIGKKTGAPTPSTAVVSQGAAEGDHNPAGSHKSQQGLGTSGPDSWTVAWDGKSEYTTLAATDTSEGREEGDNTERIYFLLPPGAHIPPLVNITGTHGDGIGKDVVLWTKPMPAIYPQGLGLDRQNDGSRGVLHTLWARRRLADLEAEIEAEMKANSESIGLQIAIQEREWISEHFGVGDPLGVKEEAAYPPGPKNNAIRAKPMTLIAGKLGEKLKGLKLATSPAELAAASQASRAAADATHSAQASNASRQAVIHTRIVPHTAIDPPAGLHNSLDAIMRGESASGDAGGRQDTTEGEDELFALPLSPRSPDMAKSPFSLL